MKRLLICLLVILLASGYTLAQEKLDLEKSLQIALEQSPVVIKARAEIKAAEGAAGQAWAGFLPQLSLSGGLGKYYSEPQTMQITMMGTPSVFSFGTDEQADTYSYTASLTQAIYTGGRLTSSLGMANKGLDIAKEELRRITQELRFNVISAYYSVLKAQKMVKLSEESVNMAKSHLEHISSLFKVGMSTRADILRGEVQLAQAELVLTKAKQALEIARNHFNSTLGRDLDVPVDLVEIEYDSKKVTIYDYKDLLKIAYESRPDWGQFILSKQISEDEVRIAYSGLSPMLSLIGNYDAGSTKYSSYQTDHKTWTALLSASWNIFDGTATWNKIKEANARLEAQAAEESNVRRAIALEVKDASFMLKSSLENLESARKTQELAEESFKYADLRYRSGIGTNLEVIDSQLSLTQARIENLEAQHDLQIAKARVNKVIGREIY
jgi:TolC family type I secretion outer membrane protein